MAVQVDVFGSCVVRDIFRHTQPGKYKVYKSAGNLPITSLYENSIFMDKKEVDELKIPSYDKVMLRAQMSRNLPELLLNKRSEILVLDLADEFMERCEIKGPNGITMLAQAENQGEFLDNLFEGNERYSIVKRYPMLEMDMQKVEEKIKKFAKDILYSEENPRGYLERNVIVVESLYTPDILGNDGNIHKHDGKYKLHEYNEWLRKVYLIFYKYFQNCKVIKLPEFTHSSQNHIRGTHPLHYMQDTYFYFERALDVACGYSQVNTLENLFKEQSLKNRTETRAANSSMMYEIKRQMDILKNDVGMLKREYEPIYIDTLGSCVSRDIFRYSFPGRYKINACIQRNPITCLYQNKIALDYKIPEGNIKKYEKRMFDTVLNQDAIRQLKNSKAKILLIDLAEERLGRCKIKSENNEMFLPIWSKVDRIFENISKNPKLHIDKNISPLDIEEKEIRRKFQQFAEDITWSENNPKGYRQEDIYVIEAMYAEKVLSNNGKARDYVGNYQVQKYNQWFRKLYTILYEYLPNCKKIKLPPLTYASENHIWGGAPLHYTDDIYVYIANVIDSLTGATMINTPENLFKEQKLKNRLKTRVLNSEKLYCIDKMQQKIRELEANINKIVYENQSK